MTFESLGLHRYRFQVGLPTPHGIFDAAGRPLLARGHVFEKREQLDELVDHHATVDMREVGDTVRNFASAMPEQIGRSADATASIVRPLGPSRLIAVIRKVIRLVNRGSRIRRLPVRSNRQIRPVTGQHANEQVSRMHDINSELCRLLTALQTTVVRLKECGTRDDFDVLQRELAKFEHSPYRLAYASDFACLITTKRSRSGMESTLPVRMRAELAMLGYKSRDLSYAIRSPGEMSSLRFAYATDRVSRYVAFWLEHLALAAELTACSGVAAIDLHGHE